MLNSHTCPVAALLDGGDLIQIPTLTKILKPKEVISELLPGGS